MKNSWRVGRRYHVRKNSNGNVAIVLSPQTALDLVSQLRSVGWLNARGTTATPAERPCDVVLAQLRDSVASLVSKDILVQAERIAQEGS